ncbi:MAG: hypothetical protein VXV85_07610 [Candidatus Thermoplasmatota archaeon]|nr:hypothetical protein [Candidatus Thermoplasmatota archaeon]
MSEEILAYPVCSGWFEEFCIWATDWLDGNCSLSGQTDEKGNFTQSDEFNMDPVCNQHLATGDGLTSSVFLSEQNWALVVEMFGYSQKEGEVQTDPYSVNPILTSKPLNTRSQIGEWSDEEIIHRIAASKGLMT